jgi:hypothetical protein
VQGANGFAMMVLMITHPRVPYRDRARYADGTPLAMDEGIPMATTKQRTAARRNIKKAAAAAKRKRTIAHLPKRTRTALGKQGASTARRKQRAT